MTASSANNIGSELLNTDELKTPLVEEKPPSSNTCGGGDRLVLAEGPQLGIKDLQNKDTSQRSQATCFTFQA